MAATLANLTNGGGGGNSAVNGGSNGSVTLSTIADNQFYARRKNPPGSRLNVVLGAQWGDEGKGKMVDMLATTADVVCRCQVSDFVVFANRPECGYVVWVSLGVFPRCPGPRHMTRLRCVANSSTSPSDSCAVMQF